jgi:hypothetical protein
MLLLRFETLFQRSLANLSPSGIIMVFFLQPDYFLKIPFPKVVVLCPRDKLRGVDPAFGVLNCYCRVAVYTEVNRAYLDDGFLTVSLIFCKPVFFTSTNGTWSSQPGWFMD